jgi:hypothetical protein
MQRMQTQNSQIQASRTTTLMKTLKTSLGLEVWLKWENASLNKHEALSSNSSTSKINNNNNKQA